jgi:tRNA (guanosine-2'-O-)-methyltransferase
VTSRYGANAAIAAALALFAVASCGRVVKAPEASPQKSAVLEASSGVEIVHGCTPSGPERCFDAVDDNCNGIIDEGCGVLTGSVQFVVAWEEPSADVDLFVRDPNGEVAEVGRTTESGLVRERDCPGSDNACHGQNWENVYLPRDTAPTGEYRATVRLESLGGAVLPLKVNVGARVGGSTFAAVLHMAKAREEQTLVLRL